MHVDQMWLYFEVTFTPPITIVQIARTRSACDGPMKGFFVSCRWTWYFGFISFINHSQAIRNLT